MRVEIEDYYKQRAEYSLRRLVEISESFGNVPARDRYQKLVIYATGSYARLEASEHSDVDVFFVNIGKRDDVQDPKTSELLLFGKVLEEADRLKLPPFSNDSMYLSMLHTQDILDHLGSPTDDHSNYFTARMLLLLESYCLYDRTTYDELARLIVDSYFTDFHDHKGTFHPRFLMNDICRYWKTMLLNYENNRRTARLASESESDPEKIELIKAKQKVKNYKLKYSRMTTCFATLAALGSQKAPVDRSQVLSLVNKTPRERLALVAEQIPISAELVETVLREYMKFLEMTKLSAEDLRAQLMDPSEGELLNQEANDYGDTFFELIKLIDQNDPKLKLLRNMVI